MLLKRGISLPAKSHLEVFEATFISKKVLSSGTNCIKT